MRELVATLTGVIGGWIFNEITMFFRERPKLTFKMVSTPETELIDKEYRTKTSLSEQGIEIYNTGKNPFILESFELCYKNKLLVDCHIVENAKVLMPSKVSHIHLWNKRQILYNTIAIKKNLKLVT